VPPDYVLGDAGALMTRKGSVGGRHIAMERGLRPGWCGWPFPSNTGDLSRPRRRVGQPANPDPHGATQGTGAQTGGHPPTAAGHFRDLSGEAAAAGLNIAQFA
jgi:hypothetical protein